jgi:predicted DNA-binding protein YlxM (UPF0122 family)
MIGDIKRSRDLDEWGSVFEKLQAALKQINREFSDDILVDFVPTVGDEFQGALRDPKHAYAVYASIKRGFRVGFYCGIGIGDIEKPLERDIGMRGDAFYRARSALEFCKRRKRSVLLRSSDTTSLADETIDTLLHFIEVMENSWTKRQREVLHYYRLHPDYTYEQLGSHFGIAKQSVRDILKAGDWDLITEGETVVNKLLQDMCSHSEESDD